MLKSKQLDLRKVYPKEIIIENAFNVMNDIIIFEEQVCTPDGLKNLLLFLEINLVSVDLLVNKVFKDDVIAFLHTIEAGYYKRRVLTESLQLYKKNQFLKTGDNVRDINNPMNFYVNSILKIQCSDLKFVDLFDLFDSSEFVK